MVTEHLKCFLQSPGGQHVQEVFVNSKGEYHLGPTVGFEKITRGEIFKPMLKTVKPEKK
jgi:hypothetical protein